MARPARALRTIPPPGHATWASAVEAFLRRDLAPGTRRVYGLTLSRVGGLLGTDQPLGLIEQQSLAQALADAYPTSSPAAWNRHVATLRSFGAFAHRHGWVDERWTGILERRREPADRSKALSAAWLAGFLDRRDLPVRERALWALLYETAARAEEVLALNVEDVDLAQRRARIVSKGGDIDVIHFATRSARLLPKVIAGRTSGPLFLADRKPAPSRVPALTDLDPTTGRARLSYRQAASLFRAATGGAGLHQLRHSAITQLAEAGVPLPLLMAKSRHVSLRTLQRYARPSTEAVARLTAEQDPLARRLNTPPR